MIDAITAMKTNASAIKHIIKGVLLKKVDMVSNSKIIVLKISNLVKFIGFRTLGLTNYTNGKFIFILL